MVSDFFGKALISCIGKNVCLRERWSEGFGLSIM